MLKVSCNTLLQKSSVLKVKAIFLAILLKELKVCNNSCKHFCKYCYANYDEQKVNYNYLKHSDNSSLLIGNIENVDVIKRRKD